MGKVGSNRLFFRKTGKDRKKNMKLSVIIIAKNEGKRIEKCIKSVSFVDEVIVINDESTDNTVIIAKKNKAIIINNKKKNFSEQRNVGLEKAKGEWILYLDADEIVTPELRKEIESIINTTSASALRITRQNYYLGKLWPSTEKLERLFKKEKLKGWYGEVHESPQVEGGIEDLKYPILH